MAQIEALSKDPDGRITEEEVTQLCAKAIEILEKVRPATLNGPLASPSPAASPVRRGRVALFSG